MLHILQQNKKFIQGVVYGWLFIIFTVQYLNNVLRVTSDFSLSITQVIYYNNLNLGNI